MEEQKTPIVKQLKLEVPTEYDQLQDDTKEKMLRKSEVVEQYPDVFSLMFKNKDAIKSHNKKKHYKQKHGK